MDGDDDFLINVSSTPLMGQYYTAGNPILIDGGHSQFRAGDALGSHIARFAGFSTDGFTEAGRGDSLVLQGSGSINFTMINDNFIKGIERIDAKNSLSNTITLGYDDVLAMTDHKKTLIINLDGSDTLHLNGAGFNTSTFTLRLDEHVVNDARLGEADSNVAYDVYSNGDVTLLISNTGGSPAVFMDGAAVTV